MGSKLDLMARNFSQWKIYSLACADDGTLLPIYWRGARSPPRPSTPPVLTPPAPSSSSVGDSRVVPFETPTLLFDPG